MSCFDAHIPVMNHRDAGAFEKLSPTLAAWTAQLPAQPQTPAAHVPGGTQETLVVVSKVKDYIRSRSSMNTSDSVMAVLTKWVIRWSEESIRQAEQHGRKTVLDRDVR